MKLSKLITKLITLEDQGHGGAPVCIVNDNTLLDLDNADILSMPKKGSEEIIIVLE